MRKSPGGEPVGAGGAGSQLRWTQGLACSRLLLRGDGFRCQACPQTYLCLCSGLSPRGVSGDGDGAGSQPESGGAETWAGGGPRAWAPFPGPGQWRLRGRPAPTGRLPGLGSRSEPEYVREPFQALVPFWRRVGGGPWPQGFAGAWSARGVRARTSRREGYCPRTLLRHWEAALAPHGMWTAGLCPSQAPGAARAPPPAPSCA